MKRNFFIFFLFVNVVNASPTTYGYTLQAPNIYWPNTTFAGIGNAIQQKTAANNPDVFCESQGDNYRLPAGGEFNSRHRSFLPMFAFSPVSPGHWSNYIDNDIAKAKKTVESGRLVNGSLMQEWGSLPPYANGWGNNHYWMTEPSRHRSHGGYPYWRDASFGRLSIQPTTGDAPAFNNNSDYPVQIELPTNQFFVACVRDLINTPSTSI